VEYVHGAVDRAHGAGPWVHGLLIKRGRRFPYQRPGLKNEGVSHLLILFAHSETNDHNAFFSTRTSEIGDRGKLPCCHLGRALGRIMRLRFLIRKLLHDLDDERYPF
jgi:hypothetical protein